MMNTKQIEQMTEVAENLDWNVTLSDNYICFQRYSTRGQDFNVDIDQEDMEDLNDLFCKLDESYQAFDVSYETYLWLDDEGHGQNGACHDMRDLYNDMEECEDQMRLLSEAIEELTK